MDPLHPLVPIQPAPPVPPDYTRIQRIERDHGRDPAPDWQHPDDEDAEDESHQEQFEDDYDPEWTDTAAAEAYNDHGLPTEGADATDPPAEPHRDWNPRQHGERRATRRSSSADYPDDPEPGPHIDIIA